MALNSVRNFFKSSLVQDNYGRSLLEPKEKICVIGFFGKAIRTDSLVLNTHWEDLKHKRILNKNILIHQYGDIHPYPQPPEFPNAEKVFLLKNHKYWHYYFLNKNIFPNNPKIYLNGHPCDSPVLDRGFTMEIVGNNFLNAYQTAVRYAKEINADTSLLKEISEEDFSAKLKSFELEAPIMVDYYQDVDEFEPGIDENNFNGIFSESILKKTKW